MEKSGKIYVAGHSGLVGSAILRKLKKDGYSNFILKTHSELDLTNQQAVYDFFNREKPEYVFVAAAKVGGVLANDTYPAEFIYENAAITINVIDAAYKAGVKKLLYMGSSCIYPKLAEQPMTEASLLTGRVEETNEAYALAKIMGVKMCEFYNRQYGTDYISCMPCNAYGPGDNFDPQESHVVPALIRKFYEAKINNDSEVVMWGTGKPIREFIFIDDIANAAVFLMNNYSGNETVNVGTGTEYTIYELAEKVKEAVGFEGKIVNDTSKPDGSPRKLLASEKIFAMGWRPEIPFSEGIKITVADYIANIDKYNK